ncbi:uncharacterized protein A1O9_03694 [Exophiala aquamarina CBS 119918]|uniref:Uncharacterized protein n=1 Tax=Exophiala aquamarina CBS 119918 TaxID=1182545 RepID=A0A072PG80_9EURO|nr:uncharacterized protein A1O9_03694 [Exophiala aquamarina CBS 119918]KEF58851.1 hypothetical protein A1O9_03694 [Exophiala aquamarina CBS 119918]
MHRFSLLGLGIPQLFFAPGDASAVKSEHNISKLKHSVGAEGSVSFISGIIPESARVDYAVPIPAGSGFGDTKSLSNNATDLPQGCAVSITVQQLAGSNISTAYFLPSSWNSRFLTIGHGGFAGYHD